MGTTAQKLQAILDSKADIAAALEEKHAVVPETLAEYGDAIRTISQNDAPNIRNPVKFVDYDGTLLYSYSLADAAALSELPDPPSHDGLTSQGWNYTLAQMKSQASSMGSCTVGCNYVTTDGATRIRIKVRDPVHNDFRINFTQSVSKGVEVDWGDGTVETFTGTSAAVRTHTYSPSEYPTEYTIALTPNSGTLRFTTNICGYTTQNTTNPAGGYCSMIESVKLGAVTSIGNYMFYYCSSLQSISISSGVTSIGSSAFNSCYSLQSISISSGVTSIRDNVFSNCCSLQSVSIPSGVTSIGNYVFSNCYSLQSISIPSSVTSIGTYVFYYCSSLQSVSIPSGVTSIGNYVFSNCSSLKSISIPSSVTSIGTYVFSSCSSLQSVSIPSGVTSIGGSTFSYCSSLKSVSIPSGVTSIGSGVFSYCYSLQSVSIPSGVTSIGGSTFSNCSSIRVYDFSNHAAVPSLPYVNAFTNTSTTKKIVVPDSLYDSWKAASNWSSTTNNIVNCIVKASEA